MRFLLNRHDPDVHTVKETKPKPISENEGEKSGESSDKEPEPDSKSFSVKDMLIMKMLNIFHLLENNIETNNLSISEKLSIQAKINNSLQRKTYELEKYAKNAMIIFNHEKFLVGDRRQGTAFDVDSLKKTFKKFRFDVTIRNDLKQQNLFNELKRFSTMDFNDYGCICVAILTHGQDGGFLRAYDTLYRERDVFLCFNGLVNRTLVGKPIIFLIQACRGSTAAARVPYGPVENVEFDADTSGNSCRPTESDMIIFHSSFFGRASVRVVKKGSWFIQTLCDQMELHGSTDHLEDLFLRVRQNVADLEYNGVKQMPAVTTTLLKHLYIFKGVDGSNSEKVFQLPVTETEVTITEVIKTLTLILFKHAYRFVIGLLLFVIIPYHDLTVSSCMFIVFLFIFQLIRSLFYKAYIAFFKQFHHFTIFLVLHNFFFRAFIYFFKQDNIPFFVYLLGCWYFLGVSNIIFLFLFLKYPL